MDKDGIVLLTQSDYDEYLQGKVSERLQQTWDISFSELQDAVINGRYKLINKDND